MSEDPFSYTGSVIYCKVHTENALLNHPFIDKLVGQWKVVAPITTKRFSFVLGVNHVCKIKKQYIHKT